MRVGGSGWWGAGGVGGGAGARGGWGAGGGGIIRERCNFMTNLAT